MFDNKSEKSTQPLLISVQDLVYEAGDAFRLQVDELQISAGGPTVILGPNGAGKSLFLRLLHGLLAPDNGSVLVNGVVPDAAVRRQQAMVFQQPVLLRRTVAANISYALKVRGVKRVTRRRKVDALLRQNGLSDQAKQAARTLSGGEQQRLALARALAIEPEVLFLDEPTSSLDPSSAGAIEEIIANAGQAGTKIIMVTHDLGLAQRLADRVIFFHKGRVCEQALGTDFFKRANSPEARAFLASNLALWAGGNS
ncbi:MAG: ATP-binding cassette domain-containing protein [Paracoccaceae bacterium]